MYGLETVRDLHKRYLDKIDKTMLPNKTDFYSHRLCGPLGLQVLQGHTLGIEFVCCCSQWQCQLVSALHRHTVTASAKCQCQMSTTGVNV